MDENELKKAFSLLDNEIARLKKRVEELEYQAARPKSAKRVNVTFRYDNLESDNIIFMDFTTGVDEGSQIPKPNMHVGAKWVTEGGQTWNFGQWRAKTDITLYEKR